jgi:hypothetical protein
VLKNAIKRRKPDFNETYYGFRAFGNLLEEAHARGLLEFGRDEKSGAYVYRSTAANVAGENVNEPAESDSAEQLYEAQVAETVVAEPGGKHESRRRGRGNRKASRAQQEAVQEERTMVEQAGNVRPWEDDAHAQTSSAGEPVVEQPEVTWSGPENAGAEPTNESVVEPVAEAVAAVHEDMKKAEGEQAERRKTRAPRKTAATKAKKSTPRTIDDIPEIAAPAEIPASAASAEEAPVAARKPARKAAPRSRRPRKTPATNDAE